MVLHSTEALLLWWPGVLKGIFLVNKARDTIYQLRAEVLKLLSKNKVYIEEEIKQLYVHFYVFFEMYRYEKYESHLY